MGSEMCIRDSIMKAEKMGFNKMNVPCAACFFRMKTALARINTDDEIAEEVYRIIGGKPVDDIHVVHERKARYVDEKKCTGCGECAEKCPVLVSSEYNTGLAEEKAISRRYLQAVPSAFAIRKDGRSPCRAACPAEQRAQGYIAVISEKRFEDAYRTIVRENPFPSVCGRVCKHYCEEECTRGRVDEPVSIMKLKQFVSDWVYANNVTITEKNITFEEETGVKGIKPVAIIGSGPAGLAAARDLAQMGHRVTVFESLPFAGGMMHVGVPLFRLPWKRLDWDIENILDGNIELKTNTRIESIHKLFEEGFGAVFIATGAHKGKKLPIPGSDLPQVLIGTEMLRSIALSKEISLGKNVLVLGGGNVAMDVARTALREGAESVKIACLESREKLPADPWKVSSGEKEDITILPSKSFLEIVSTEGRLEGVRCIDIFSKDSMRTGARKSRKSKVQNAY